MTNREEVLAPQTPLLHNWFFGQQGGGELIEEHTMGFKVNTQYIDQHRVVGIIEFDTDLVISWTT